MARKTLVIGGGMEGLGAACELAASGCAVTLVEKSGRLGGRFDSRREHGFDFDLEPAPLIDPAALDALFSRTGRLSRNYLSLHEVEPRLRCFFPDGAVVNVRSDPQRMAGVLDQQFPVDRPGAAYEKLMALSERALAGAGVAFDRALASAHPRVRGLFEAFRVFGPGPAAGALGERGVAHAEGGARCIARALERLAAELGVEFELGEEAVRLIVEGGAAVGILARTGERRADAVILAAGDSGNRALLGGGASPSRRRELRIFLGLNRRPPMFARHNALLDAEGTIHIAAPDAPRAAPGALVICAPAGEGEWSPPEVARVRARTFSTLERFGVSGLSEHIAFERIEPILRAEPGSHPAPPGAFVAAPSALPGAAMAARAGVEAALRSLGAPVAV